MRSSTFYLSSYVFFTFVTVIHSVDDFDTYIRQLKDNNAHLNRTSNISISNIKENFLAQKLLNSKDTANYGPTKFSHLSSKEFKARYLSDLRNMQPFGELVNTKTPLEKIKALNIPQKWDWRNVNNRNYVSPVKNQNSCGACWAFSSTETVETMYALKYNVSAPRLSVQEIIDCSSKNNGCYGGDTCFALDWLIESHVPLVSEVQYPLKDKSEYCKVLTSKNKGVHVTNYTCDSMIGNEQIMVRWLYYIGPLTVAVDATTWNHYLNGIIQFHCEDLVNHAVQIVGYDISGDIPYYIVRNSWGTDFGIDGYLHIKIGDNLCGIAREVSTVQIL